MILVSKNYNNIFKTATWN